MNAFYQQFETIYKELSSRAPDHPDLDTAASCLAREQITSNFCQEMRFANLYEAADCKNIAKAVARCDREQRAISAVMAAIDQKDA